MIEGKNTYPLVSICVPIYNVSAYLNHCLDTILGQTYPNIEYIFVDDCSTDDSFKLLKKRLQSCKRPYQIIENKENRGLATVRNIAVTHTKGDFITWVDSDDYVSEELVTKMIAAQTAYDLDIVTTDFIEQYENYEQPMVHPSFHSAEEMACLLLARRTPVCIWGRLIRTRLYKDYSIKPKEDVNCGEDYQVTARLAYYAKRVGNIHEFLYIYNCTNIQSYTHCFSHSRFLQDWMSIDVLKTFFKDKEIIYQKALEVGILELSSHQLVACCQVNDKASFRELHRNIKDISLSAYAFVPIFLRLSLYISNYNLARLYIIPAAFLLKIIKRTKRWLKF